MTTGCPNSSFQFPTAETAKCTFNISSDMKKAMSASDYPHRHETGVYDRCTGPISTIYDTILEHIGMTPMVRLNSVPQSFGIKCEIVGKCEFFNAGGSVKDRIGRRMVLDAEKSGRIKPGDTLIEPTSGNTGIGLALTAAVRGYRMVITLPEKMSNEKVFTLQSLGAKIYRTPTEAAFDSPESHIGLANRLNKEIPNSHILDQYSNPSNPLAHFDGTAEEILKQCNNKIDMVVIGAGTGGTITGIAGKIKQRLPNCIIVGVDPFGSILAQPEKLNSAGVHSYHVEGIGYDFIPQVLQRRLVDYWVKTNDKESFVCARRLIREEGLLCGGSSGSALMGAIKAIRHFKLGENQRCVVLFPDSIRNYMTKFLTDEWMLENNFYTAEVIASFSPKTLSSADNDQQVFQAHETVSNLCVSTAVTISSRMTCKQAIDVLNKQRFDQLPVMNGNIICGVVTVGNLSSKLLKRRVNGSDCVLKATFSKFKTVSLDTSLNELSAIFNSHHFVLVVSEQKQYHENEEVSTHTMVIGILTRIDLLSYVVSSRQSSNQSGSVGSSIEVECKNDGENKISSVVISKYCSMI